MLKKRKQKIKRRNTEPTVNHQTVLSTPSTGSAGPQLNISGQYHTMLGQDGADGTIPEHPPNLADICDSPTHATAV